MKNYLLIFAIFTMPLLHAQNSIFGKWKTVDDVSGKVLGVVEIYEKGGKVYGKVVDITDPKSKSRRCTKCDGDDKDKPIMGLTIIKGLKKDGDEYNGGRILDPKSGSLYRCYITLEEPDKLKVRGYIGLSLFGRTQYWHRIK